MASGLAISKYKSRKWKFQLILAAFIVIKLIIAILIIACLSSVADSARDEVGEIFEKRDENIERINKFQKTYECCGIHNYTFWVPTPVMEVPQSCCSETSLTDNLGVCIAKNAHEQGCGEKLASQVETIGTVLYITLLVIVLLEALGLSCFYILQRWWWKGGEGDTYKAQSRAYATPMYRY